MNHSPRAEWLRTHSADIVESASDQSRDITYVVPKPGGAAKSLRQAAGASIRLVKNIPVTPDGSPDFEQLAGYEFVTPELVSRCQQTLDEQGISAVATCREYFEPRTLVLGRNLYSASSTEPASSPTPVATNNLPPAYAAGPPLEWSGPNHATLVEALRSHTAPDQGITYLENGQERFESYAEILAAALKTLHGLQKLGLKKGDPLPLQINDRAEHFHIVWGCLLGGIIPVTIAVPNRYEADNPVFRKLLGVWKLLGGQHVVASSDNVEPLRRLMPDEAEICDAAGLDTSADGQPADLTPDDIVFYQLTSGSTGTPKCIPETHGAIISQIKFSTVDVGYAAADRTLNWLPFDHVVPMLTFHMKDVYLGCHAFQAPTAEVLAEPTTWLDIMEKHLINYSWSPNFGFKLVATAIKQYQSTHGGSTPTWDLTCIKKLMNAGEQVTEVVCEDFLRLTGLSPEVMQPSFGMAEVATCMTYANDYGSGYGTSVHRVLKSSLQGVVQEANEDTPDAECLSLVDLGPPSPGVEIRITQGATSDQLGEGQIGHFQIRGPSVMPGYVKNPDANAESFVGEGWFDSGDLGFILRGRLVLTGRAKEMIIVRGANFYAYEIEDSIAELPGCRPAFVAATSVLSESTGTESVLVFFVPDPEIIPPVALDNLANGYVAPKLRELVASIHSKVASAFGVNPEYVVPVTERGFHKTTSGKIQRSAFKKEFLAGEYVDVCSTMKRALQQDAQCIPDWFCEAVWQRRDVWEPTPCDADETPDEAASRDTDTSAETSARQRSAGELIVFQPSSVPLSGELAATMISPGNGVDWSRVAQAARIVYAWPCDPETAGRAYGDLIQLGKSLGKVDHDVELYVVTRRAIAVDDQDPLDANCLAQVGGLSGILKALPAELPSVRKAVQIDLDDPLQLADRLAAEIRGRGGDQEVAWREGQRYVKRYRNVGGDIASEVFSRNGSADEYIRPGGAYVVTGGLGGIGQEVVKLILEVRDTSVLILGRSENGEERMKEFGWSSGATSRVAYAAIDLGESTEQLENEVRSWLDRQQKPITGVMHLAGHYDRQTIEAMDESSFAAAIRAKVQGSIDLHHVLKKLATPDSLPASSPTFLHFGSITSVFAGQGLAAYSTACSFQEVFAKFQRQDGIDARVFSWSIWQDTGVAARDKTLGFAPWVCPIRKPQGVNTLKTLLDSTDRRALYVGVNSRHPDLARLAANGSDFDLDSLCVFHTPGDCLDVGRFGQLTKRQLEYICVPELPVDSRGQVDVEKLAAATIKSLTAIERAAAQNETESRVSQIWQDVLGLGELGRDDNFFDLGGDSLSWMGMVAKCNDAFGLNLRAMQILEHVSIAELGAHIDTMKAGNANTETASAQADKILLTLKPGDADAAPVFLFPTLAGTTACYNELLSHVDARRPFVGLIDPYLTGDRQSRLLAFADWTARYAEAIQSRQPHGPYTLISYSQGSTWLWGAADHLRSRGEEVEQCILLDPFMPGWNGIKEGIAWMATLFASFYWPVPRRLVWRMVRLKTRLSGWGWGAPMKTERERELSLAATYHKYSSKTANLWLFVIFMELDTGVRILDDISQLKQFPRDRYDDAVDFVCKTCAEKLRAQSIDIDEEYLKDVIYVMSYAFLRAQTYEPSTMPESTRVTAIVPQRKKFSLCKENGIDKLVHPDNLTEIVVPLEPLDRQKHVTGRLKGDYHLIEDHYRCMHDGPFLAKCVEVFQQAEIAR